jgi:hypothetical protein
MLKKTLNGLLIVFLMLSYINRGLFVDMSEANVMCSSDTSQKKNEINSVLELIFNLTGYANDIDEDGDSPENYISFQFSKLLVCQEFYQNLTIGNLLPKNIKRTFCVLSDAIYSLPVYGQIDHPPQG